jgi:hypothetical protein
MKVAPTRADMPSEAAAPSMTLPDTAVQAATTPKAKRTVVN